MPGDIMLLLFALTVIVCHSQEAGAATISVKNFGVAGDGTSDDGPAIRKAVEAATKGGPGTKLVFESKAYRLGANKGGNGQIRLVDVDGLTIDGNGSTLLLHPQNGMFDVLKCRNVVIRGFTIDFDPLPFTQGTISSVDAGKGFFDLEFHKGYPLPLPDEAVKKRLGKGGWRWGSVIDPKERHRRWGIADHYSIDSINLVAGRTYRITVAPSDAKQLTPVRPGDRFFLPLQLTEKGERAFGSNITVKESTDCTIEDITIYSARCGMNYAITRNEGLITLRNNKITFKPGSTRICTTWKDGMHVKDNRVGPLIEGCYFEGMLDDSINISANTAMATKIISPTEFQLMGPAFSAGDDVMVFEPKTGKIRMTMVVKATAQGRDHLVTLADPMEGVITGRKQREHVKSTHFYNMSYVNNGFIVRNCTFKPQRRHALLVRCSNGLFEGNTVDGVGGAAVWMGNEMGSFYEGPFPTNNIVRNNTINNTQLPAIKIYTRAGGKAKLTRNIKVEDNTITVLPEKLGISVLNAASVECRGNRILDQQGTDIGAAGVILND
ncbi:MAG: right-handed parallel beta-helix repeat-containing protein [Kiritimatiellia bacterium]|jgi:hypothetical protein|nr:right-handed parallel beta-helix repeat-containing protein [Kiritimatiellia bacterium]MDP6809254.1 right-handed parallel beta-helix repeat-containing protein [Kiritimatiellia bacterium]MDP7022993.1 right-handed parallel beta-helix repeat-containing protein [Kiritimatiellia bacterium]